MYLLDTNIWLEHLLSQEKSDEVGRFLEQTSSEQIFMTDFTLHSIGVILTRLKQTDTLIRFVQDVFVQSAVVLIHLEPIDTTHLVQAIEQFGLDFDDAYQYVAAERYNLILVSFDSDFDRTQLRRNVPVDLIEG